MSSDLFPSVSRWVCVEMDMVQQIPSWCDETNNNGWLTFGAATYLRVLGAAIASASCCEADVSSDLQVLKEGKANVKKESRHSRLRPESSP